VERDEMSKHGPASAVDDTTGESRRGRRQRRVRRPTAHPRRRTVIETVIGIAIAVVIALGFRAFVFQAYFIPSSSMVPTLQVGDRILVNKFDFNYHSVHAGDIVVFRTPPAAARDCSTSDGDLVKRVVATQFQTITSKGNEVLIKDPSSESWRVLPERYFPDDGRNTPLGQVITPYKVPRNDFFVMGDNRTDSCDSRIWGALPGSDIVGRVVAVVWRGWHPDLIIF
jgi:signal peptidase I